MDLKIAIMSSYLNFTIKNCFFKEKKNTLRKTTCRVGNTTQLQLLSLHQICVPWECAVMSVSGLGVCFQLCPPPWSACLALNLLEIYSRNRRNKTHLNSRGGECISCLIVAVDQEGDGH